MQYRQQNELHRSDGPINQPRRRDAGSHALAEYLTAVYSNHSVSARLV
jgi:hypothetical protein